MSLSEVVRVKSFWSQSSTRCKLMSSRVGEGEGGLGQRYIAVATVKEK
jgi:hypothetical protein